MDHQILMAVLRTLAKIGPNADSVFRDECKFMSSSQRQLYQNWYTGYCSWHRCIYVLVVFGVKVHVQALFLMQS